MAAILTPGGRGSFRSSPFRKTRLIQKQVTPFTVIKELPKSAAFADWGVFYFQKRPCLSIRQKRRKRQIISVYKKSTGCGSLQTVLFDNSIESKISVWWILLLLLRHWHAGWPSSRLLAGSLSVMHFFFLPSRLLQFQVLPPWMQPYLSSGEYGADQAQGTAAQTRFAAA